MRGMMWLIVLGAALGGCASSKPPVYWCESTGGNAPAQVVVPPAWSGQHPQQGWATQWVMPAAAPTSFRCRPDS